MWILLPCIPALIILYQDFKYRAISWWTLPLFLISTIPNGLIENKIFQLLEYGAINMLVLIIEISILFLYFSIKNKRITNIFNTYFGIGDALFLLVITPFLHPITFVLFQIGSLSLILAGSVIYGLIKKNWTFKIPLAGILALFFYLILVYKHFSLNQLCLNY